MVLSSGFLIAVILTLVSLGCWLIKMFNSKKIKTILLSIFILVMVVFVGVELLLKYSDSVLDALRGTFYEEKVEEIINALLTDQTTGKLEGRTNRYMESITGIFRFPIIGAKILGLESELGGHSTLIDMLGAFGVIAVGFYYAIFAAIKSLYKAAEHKGFIIALIILFVLNGTLNTLVGSHGIIFIVIPGVIMLANRGDEK